MFVLWTVNTVMAQEFHVLRCFSCQIVQVQQVKKSKKWECKVCGEKQSVIKEYGRGPAADCRRHVQKLNYLRGELQEVNTETVLSQWEQDKDYKNEHVNPHLNSNKSEQVVATLSCWSKYINQTTECPKLEDEKEEKNIYTEPDQFRTQETSKRLLVSKLKVVGGHFKDKESWTGCQFFNSQPYQTSSWKKGCFSKYSHNNGPTNVSCTSTHLLTSPQAVSSYHTASTSYSYTVANCSKGKYNFSLDQPGVQVSKHLQLNNGPCAPLSSQKFAESKLENKASKWSQFLSVVPPQEEDNVDGHLSPSALIDNTMVSKSTGTLTNINSQKHRNPPAVRIDTGDPRKQNPAGNICGEGKSFYQTNSPLLASEPNISEKPVRNQPLTKMLSPGFSLNPLFFTNEDFDDTFN